MGYVPIRKPTENEIIAQLERQLRWRGSRWRSRRRRAHSACLRLIDLRERQLASPTLEFGEYIALLAEPRPPRTAVSQTLAR